MPGAEWAGFQVQACQSHQRPLSRPRLGKAWWGQGPAPTAVPQGGDGCRKGDERLETFTAIGRSGGASRTNRGIWVGYTDWGGHSWLRQRLRPQQ